MATSLPYLLHRQFRPQALRFHLRIPPREIIRDRANSPPCHGPAAAVFSAVWRSYSSASHFYCTIIAASNFRPCSFIGGLFFSSFLDSSSSTSALPAVTSQAPPGSPPVKSSW